MATVHILTIANQKEARRALKEVGVDPAGFTYMAPKMQHALIKIKDLDVRAANVLKQEMLAKGAEAAVAKWSSGFTQPTTDIILMATLKQYSLVLSKLPEQPFGLSKLVEPVKQALDSIRPTEKKITCGRHTLSLGGKTLIMGILNITPDSFSESGIYFDEEKALARVEEMVAEGVDIIDIGGESTRPAAEPVSEDEELRRVVPVIEKLASKINVPISIDTSKARVARAAVDAGAVIVNDITALTGDKEMAAVCASADVGVILMHMQGQPRTMQENPEYKDLMSEIIGFLDERVAAAGRAGIDRDRILIDPGIGFGKTVGHNLEIIKRLRELKSLGLPLVLGTSRKATIGKVLGDFPPGERLEGTAATVAVGIINGADIVRVHDVKEMVMVARMTDAIIKGEG